MLTSIGKYEILEEIGHGGMATVYRARDRSLQRLVALKVMHPHLQGAKEARARFAREALTVARLRHPGLLEIFDYSGEDSDIGYIATELLEGPTLKTFLEAQRQVPAEIACCIALQVAEALAVAHQAGVIHRDVKPENVMFHRGRLKLTDFGIAQLADVQGMTATGQVLGSPGHMAPEQIEGKACSPSTDVFALGTVLYQLVVGEAPFAGRNPHQTLKQVIEGRFRDPLQACPTMGSTLRDIIVRCLASDPQERYGVVDDLAKDLQAFLEEGGVEQPAECLSDYSADPPTFAAAFQAKVLERQTELGLAAQKRGRYPQALVHFNRVLAMDPGNARVLAAVQQLGRRERLQRAVGVALATLGVAGLLMLGARAWSSDGEGTSGVELPQLVVSVRQPKVQSAQGPTGDTGVKLAGPPAPAGLSEVSTSEGGGQESPSVQSRPSQPERRAAEPDNGKQALTAGRVRPVHEPSTSTATSTGLVRRPLDEDRALTTDDAASEGLSPPAAAVVRGGPSEQGDLEGDGGGGQRQVIFKPRPANVSIAVDDQPPRPFGPSFHQVALTPGEHHFRFIGAHECCVDASFTFNVEPGKGPVVLARTLRFRSAGLYVVTNVPANVEVDSGEVRGRARSVMYVPHQAALDQSHVIRVTAPGYVAEQRHVDLRAGKLRTIEVDLRPKVAP